jgi:hypothetical protein
VLLPRYRLIRLAADHYSELSLDLPTATSMACGGVCSIRANGVNESMRYCSLPLDLICEFLFAHAHHVSPERTTNASTPADLLAGRIGKLAIAWYPLASPARASTGVIRTGKGRRASNIRDRGLGLGSQIHQAFACGGRY